MAVFRQPRVPEYQEGKGLARFLRDLVRFLKDFCMDTWMAHRQNEDSIEALKRRMDEYDGTV